MSLRRVANVVGLLQVFVALAMLLTAAVALYYGDGDHGAFVLATALTLAVGGGVYWLTRTPAAQTEEITVREGFVIVTLAWTATAVFGALPYVLSGVAPSRTAAFFESMSGFTTTGSTVFGDVEALPHGILFWRSLTHWLGGMGIIVLVIAVLPYLGVGGMQLFLAEVPGPTPERLRPRITQTAKLLWLVYFGLTLAQTTLYVIGGMGFFDAINHSFSTLATGGFSTKNASFAAYDSPYLHWVTTVFMALAGANFALHFKAATGRPTYLADSEFRLYAGILLLAGLVVTGANLAAPGPEGLERAARLAFFQVASLMTTTGFVAADYERWATGSQIVLFALLFVGGMAGSTGGGIKTIRVLLLLKQTGNELKRHLHPRAVLLARVGRQAVKEDVLANVVGFVILYLLICLAGAILLGLMGNDPLTAVAASAATLGNVGPGFGALGATEHYGGLSSPELAVASALMLVGRLEIYTVLLLFHPETWRARRSYH